jgi:hypothetical protein
LAELRVATAQNRFDCLLNADAVHAMEVNRTFMQKTGQRDGSDFGSQWRELARLPAWVTVIRLERMAMGFVR